MKATKAEVVPVETPLNSTRNKHACVWPIQLQTRLLDRFHPLVARLCSNFPNSRTSATFELAVQCTKGANHAPPRHRREDKSASCAANESRGWKKEMGNAGENRDTRRLVSFLFSLIFISSNNFTAILSPLIVSRCPNTRNISGKLLSAHGTLARKTSENSRAKYFYKIFIKLTLDRSWVYLALYKNSIVRFLSVFTREDPDFWSRLLHVQLTIVRQRLLL